MSGSGSAAAKPSRRGSDFSDKQIARAAMDEKRVVVRTLTRDISGYVMGVDDFHWGIVTSEGEVNIVHKSAPSIVITTKTVSDLPETDQRAVRSVTQAFRDFCSRTS